MAHYLNNLVNSTWTGWSELFEGLPYGDPYISIATLIALFAMSTKILANGWR